ncbi:hypothetical protein [Parabacteroides sp.]
MERTNRMLPAVGIVYLLYHETFGKGSQIRGVREMDLQHAYIRETTFRFKRWSRKGYAAFFSLGRAVTIGQLSSNVAERFQVKNGSNHSSVLVGEQGYAEEEGKVSGLAEERSVTDTLPLILPEFLLLSLQAVKREVAASSAYTYIIYPKSGEFQHKLELPAFSFPKNSMI